jgi:hypothetical protein
MHRLPLRFCRSCFQCQIHELCWIFILVRNPAELHSKLRRKQTSPVQSFSIREASRSITFHSLVECAQSRYLIASLTAIRDSSDIVFCANYDFEDHSATSLNIFSVSLVYFGLTRFMERFASS